MVVMVELKNEEQFRADAQAGLVVARTLELLRGEVKDGVTTAGWTRSPRSRSGRRARSPRSRATAAGTVPPRSPA